MHASDCAICMQRDTSALISRNTLGLMAGKIVLEYIRLFLAHNVKIADVVPQELLLWGLV